MKPRYVWTPRFVSNTHVAAAHVRAYLEFGQLGRILDDLPEAVLAGPAADVGAGYGRLAQVLRSRFPVVVAYEREPKMSAASRRLMPDVTSVNVPKLTALPAVDGSFAFAMAFTVLQHMGGRDAAKVIREMRRIVRPGGYVLITEDTDPGHVYSDPDAPGHITLGRSVRWYRAQMEPMRLVSVERRPMEPGFRYRGKLRPYVGHYMLFGPEE